MKFKISKPHPSFFFIVFFSGLVALLSYKHPLMPIHQWKLIPLHSLIEGAGGMIAFFTAGLLLVLLKTEKLPRYYFPISAMLIIMSVFDISHAMVAPGNAFVWLHSLAVLAGGLASVFIWLPKRFFLSRQLSLSLVLVSLFVTLTLASLLIIYYSSILPMAIKDWVFTPVVTYLNIIGGLFLLIAGGRLFVYSNSKNDTYKYDFIFVIFLLSNGISGLLFYFSEIWSPEWWLWHIIRLGAYIFVGFYFFVAYQESDIMLETEKKKREQAEQILQEKIDELASSNIGLNAESKKEKEKLEIIFNSATDAIFILKMDGNFIDVNKTACERLGYTKEELIKMGIPKLDTPEFAPRVPARVKEIIEKGHAIFESAHVKKDGTVMPVEINASVIDYAGTPAMLSIIRDITERKKTQLEILAKNKQIVEAQEIAQLGSYLLDVSSGIWKSSEILDKIFGISKDYQRDVEGWAGIVHPEERELMVNYLKNNVFKKKEPFDREYRIIRLSDSKVRWVHGLGSLSFDQKGKITTMIGTIQDITEAKISQEKMLNDQVVIKESKLKYRGLIENTPMCIKVFDKDGNLKFLNKGGREEHHIKEGDDLLKWDWLGTVKPEYIPGAKKVFAEAFKGKSGEVEFEHTEESKAHPWCHGLISPILDEKGKVVNVLFYSIDVTKRKKTEEALLRSQKEQERILNSISSWIFYKDTENRFVRVNKAFAEIMKTPKEKLEGVSLFDIFPKEQAEAFWADDKAIIKSGKSKFNIVEPMNSPSGVLWVQTDKMPYRDESGKIIGVIGFATDITARKLSEDAFKKHAEELEKINQIMIGRENKMMDLKEKIEELEKKLQINSKINNKPAFAEALARQVKYYAKQNIVYNCVNEDLFRVRVFVGIFR